MNNFVNNMIYKINDELYRDRLLSSQEFSHKYDVDPPSELLDGRLTSTQGIYDIFQKRGDRDDL